MASISITSHAPLYDGIQLTFRAPCNSEDATSVVVNGIEYALKDSYGSLAGVANAFVAGAYVGVKIDTVNRVAYVTNASTSSYLEAELRDIKNSAASVQIEFDSGDVETTRYSYAGTRAQIYVFALHYDLDNYEWDCTMVLNRSMLSTSEKTFHAAGDGATPFDYPEITAYLDTNGYPVFRTPSMTFTISRVVGYY